MFTKNTYNIGSFEVISVRNSQGIGIDFIPQKGGAIHQLYLGAKADPIFSSFNQGDDIELDVLFKQALLFPFSSRLKAGKYSFEGKNYNFPINEVENNNALHGFLSKETLEVESIDLSEDKAIINLVYKYDGGLKHYPFPFQINITYTVSQSEFALDFTIENQGSTSLPYGFGWHPYFEFKEGIRINMPESLKQLVDAKGIVTGQEKAFSDLSKYEVLTEPYDTCFKYQEKKPHTLVLGMGDEYSIELWQDETLGYIQLYTPSFKQIALEPLTSNINALNTKKGLITLPAGEDNTHQIKIIYKPNE